MSRLSTPQSGVVIPFSAAEWRARQLRRALEDAYAEAEALRSELARARSEAQLDHLTGLPNRRQFEASATQARRGEVIALCDIDDFKVVNDRHGHLAGDRVLQVVAWHLRDALSHCALVARYGGEEFALLFAPIDLVSAAAALDEARGTLTKRIARMRDDDLPIERLSFSAGIAVLDGDVRDTLRHADDALYAAKRGGKDRVAIASPATVVA